MLRRIVRVGQPLGCGLSALVAVVAAPCALADDLVPPKVLVTSPGGINVADGSFIYSVTDLAIGPMKLERFQVTGPKNGLVAPATPHISSAMGDNFDIYVAANFKHATKPPFPLPERYEPVVHLGASAQGVYELPTTAPFAISPNNLDANGGNLSLTGGVFNGNMVYTDRDGTVFTFDATNVPAPLAAPSQRIAQIAFADGRLQTFYYVGTAKQLKRVDDSSGYAIVFDYDASGFTADACAFDTAQTYVSNATTCTGAALKVTYSHDSANNLMSVVDVTGQTTTFNGGSWGVTCIKPPGYSTCKVALNYGPGIYPTTQTMADGSVWSAANSDPTAVDAVSAVPDADCGEENSLTDPNGKITYMNFTNTSPCRITDPDGNTTTYQYTGAVPYNYFGSSYHDGSMLIEADFPEGNKYLAEYHGIYNSVTKETWKAKPGSTLADRVITYTYSSSVVGAKIATKTDPNGNVTNYDYYSWGGIKSEMQPAPTSGAARPLKLYDYVQKYAYIKNASGALVAAATPIWVANSETECQTVAGSSTATCDTAAPIMVTTYEYNTGVVADNLLLRGKVVTANGLSLRTCYGYDAQSNRIWETSPRGTTSASCS
jgi:hypothetical protein